jgi:hypothetical protein
LDRAAAVDARDETKASATRSSGLRLLSEDEVLSFLDQRGAFSAKWDLFVLPIPQFSAASAARDETNASALSASLPGTDDELSISGANLCPGDTADGDLFCFFIWCLKESFNCASFSIMIVVIVVGMIDAAVSILRINISRVHDLYQLHLMCL